jgi:restriction system protein
MLKVGFRRQVMKVEIKSRYLESIQVGDLDAKYSVDGTRILRYFINFQHKILNTHKELSAAELFLLQHKVDALMAQWDQKCDEHRHRSRIFAGKEAAERQTIEAKANLDALSKVLQHTLKVDDRVDWNALKDHSDFIPSSRFSEAKPRRIVQAQPSPEIANITFWDRLLFRNEKKAQQVRERNAAAVAAWRDSEAQAQKKFEQDLANWERRLAAHASAMEEERENFIRAQSENNSKIDRLSAGVAIGDPVAIVEHASLVLEASDYNDLFEKSFELEYQQEAKTLLVEYQLPSPNKMPTIKSVRFVTTTGEMKEFRISDREQKANYESVCYQVCLRTFHELFEADEFGNIDRILFNGVAHSIDRATGQDISAIILSLLVSKDEFLKIDLSRVDPKSCFKSLKGVSAASLFNLVPIPPVMKFDKSDRRFIDPREAIENIEETTNLAAMDWEEFEHLVREVFEKEFASRGGEVKITRSTSDGGVDAVAFDPDPITGGKIIIQAKRYTRTVGVAAVRDLYGTMQHEAASRGVLVTTADYGPDAHAFASGKHITLMTGANLLHLLERHGIRAKIDIREARKELNLRELRR